VYVLKVKFEDIDSIKDLDVDISKNQLKITLRSE